MCRAHVPGNARVYVKAPFADRDKKNVTRARKLFYYASGSINFHLRLADFASPHGTRNRVNVNADNANLKYVFPSEICTFLINFRAAR